MKEWNLGRSRRLLFPDLSPGRGGLSTDATGRYAFTTRPVGPPPDQFSFREVVLWDISSGQPRELFRKPLAIPGSPHAVAMPNIWFSPDGRRVLVTYLEDRRRRPDVIFPAPRNVGHLLPTPVDWFGGLTRASFSWTSQLPILARSEVWDIPSGDPVLDLPRIASGQRYSRDGRYLSAELRRDPRLSWERGEQVLWDLAAKPARRVALEEPSIPVGPDEHINQQLVFGPGDRYLTAVAETFRISQTEPRRTTGVYLLRWELETGRLVFARPLPDLPRNPSGDPRRMFDNRFLLSPDANRIVSVPNSEDGQPVVNERPEFRMWELRPNGETVRLWSDNGDWITGRDEGSTSNLTQLRAEFTSDGKRLVIVAEKQARVYNLDAMDKPIILRGVRGFPLQAALSDDGRRLVMVSNLAPLGSPKQMELKIWDLAGGQELIALPVSLPERFGESFVRTFDGKGLKLLIRTPRGGELFTLDGSPRDSKR